MKLPNDLIKATDYSKAKNREIHEFEYRDEKYIHKYVLGGEHELTPQEIIDCLNAISTIDCDLQTAYAFIQGQKDKISDLEAKLAESEKKNFELIAKLNLKEHRPAFCTLADRECEALGKIEQLKQQLAEKESEADQRYKDWQEEIRECDGLRVVLSEVRKQLAEKEKEIEKLKSENHALMSDNAYQEADMFELTQKLAIHTKAKISFAVEQLEKVKWIVEDIQCACGDDYNISRDFLIEEIDNQIKQLKEGK